MVAARCIASAAGDGRVASGEDYYRTGQVAHDDLVERLRELEGRWLLSYENLPDGLSEYPTRVRGTTRGINSGKRGSGKEATERLVMNFEPETTGES